MRRFTCALAAVSVLWMSCSLLQAQANATSKTFEVTKGGTLVVVTGVGDIQLQTGDRNQVIVKVEGIDPEELDRLTMTQSGNTVRVEFRPESGGSHDVRFFIDIPRQFNVDLRTAGGDISVEGALSGTLDSKTSGGDIRLDDVNGKATATTAGGDITAGRIEGDATLKTSGGDIKLESVQGQVEVTTAGGDIEVGDVGKTLTAKTAGGDIRIGSVGGDATVSTAGGDVRVNKVAGSATLKTAGGDIGCAGATGTVTAKTAGGDVNLREISGAVQASTAGGNIAAELNPTGQGPSKMSTAGGDVRLYVPESAKARIEARIRIEGRWKVNSQKYDIRSDFTAQDYKKDETAEEIRGTYELNGGGELITLETVNGNIVIRKGRAPVAAEKK